MEVSLAACLALLLPVLCLGQVQFPNRFSTNPCTLLKDLEAPCQLKSLLGANPSADSFNGLYMQLGETNCTVQLERCRPKTCYSIRDLTTGVSASPGVALTAGWFTHVNVVSGATGLMHTREGVAFTATSDTVVLTYSTQLCADYWRVRDSVGHQSCTFPVEAITVVDADTPNALPCGTA